MRSRFRILLLFLAVPTFGHTTITVNPGGGADQTSLSAAEAACPDPLTDDYIISCAGSTNDTTAATIDVATLNGATQHTLEIHGDAAAGIFDDSKYQMAPTGASTTPLTISTTYVTVHHLQITGYGASTYSYHGIYVTGNYVTIRDNLIQNFIRAPYSGICFNTVTAGREAHNNVIWNCTRGIYPLAGCQATCYNNTVSGCTAYGVYLARNTTTVDIFKNNLITGSATADWYQTATTGSLTTAKNYTADATSPNAGCASATITFVNAGGEDFHLDAGMAGTLLGEDLSETFTLDIDAETRAFWYAGADELPPATKATLLIQLLSR